MWLGDRLRGIRRRLRPQEYFNFEFRPSEQNQTDLLVSVSTNAKFGFYQSPFATPTLFIGNADRAGSYYIRGVAALIREIQRTVRDERRRTRRVLFVGVSKAGWGALRLATLCAEADPSRTYLVIAFSPQTMLHPPREDLPFPSYYRMIEVAKANRTLMKELAKFGSLPEELSLKNLRADIYFGSMNEFDAREAQRIYGTSVRQIPLPLSGHLSHLPFVVDTSNKAAVTKVVEKGHRLALAAGDEDAYRERDDLIAELLAMERRPHVVQLVREMFDAN